MKIVEELRVEFEKTKLFMEFNEKFNIYYTNLGGYHYLNDNRCSFYLNGALQMYEELNK